MASPTGWDIKITDFGLSRLLEYDQMLTTMCGTPMFLAPEVLSSKKRGGYDFSVDYWSIGVVLYLMLVGHPPYNEKDGNLLELVKNGRFSFPASTWKNVSNDAKDLVQRLMSVDVHKRFDGAQTLAHRWMRESVPRTLSLSGRKRQRKSEEIGDEKGAEENEENERARKRFKRADGVEVDASKMQMSMDSMHDLTPFDSIIEKKEAPKSVRRRECEKTDTTQMKEIDHENNAVSMKEMSLD